MPAWGRAAAAAGSTEISYGYRSVVIGMIALVIGVVTFTGWAMVGEDASEAARTIATGAFMIGFLGVAPLLNLVGFIFGIIAIVRPNDSKGLAILGLILNAGIVAVGFGLLYLLLSAAAAFT